METFQVIGDIGNGSYGAVSLAIHIPTGKQVCL